jgi:hypothetical protein
LKAPELKALAGQDKPSRQVSVLFPDHASRPDPDLIAPPKWLCAAAKKIWADKVNRYRQRSQKVGGFEDGLAQYCALEAELIALYRKKNTPPMAMVTAHRVWASEFYDTPASQVAKPGSKPGGSNAFGRIGQPPPGKP